ncbi:hypothetical protein Ddye_001480 [Dipteronia dyeriana]|uniref:BHLH domain-containing protein n=1 Tax=Dipteronia dyeriana TaxID=168575 RepID=A0AAE0CTJ6_9ROSI|nr:hypothetical protein Ddye_001480 [Dipteronia dyeriana]
MVKVHQTWPDPQNSALQLPDLNCMNSSLDPGQPECSPTNINPGTCMFPENVSLPGFTVPGLAKLKTEQTNGANMLLKMFPSHFQTLVPNTLSYLEEKQSAFTCGFMRETMPNATLGSLQKGLLVFDQSGSETRLLYTSVFPSVLSPPVATRNPGSGFGLPEEKAVMIGQFNPVNPIFSEESDENHICVDESEMHEDSDEINALLYSDEDDDYSDDDDDDNEVMSTDHSPIANEGSYKKDEHIETITEEIAPSDSSNKRQKLLDGGYNKSSEVVTACLVKLEGSNEYDHDAESSYVGRTQREEEGSISGNQRSRKGKIRKIRETLRILESIIPSVKGKDPLSVLDEAIDYLQSLKLKAKALEV